MTNKSRADEKLYAGYSPGIVPMAYKHNHQFRRTKMVDVQIKNGNLILSMPISKERSHSGKTTLVACTHGATQTNAKVDGQTVYVSLNAYIYPNKE
jgi:hypothetical protein